MNLLGFKKNNKKKQKKTGTSAVDTIIKKMVSKTVTFQALIAKSFSLRDTCMCFRG